MNRFRNPGLVAAAVLASASAGAHAATNIDATTGTPTTVALGAGTYQISWVGKAGGGMYDAWQYNTNPSGNYRDAFTLTIAGNSTAYTYDVSTPNHYANYSTAAAALGAFQTSTSFDILSAVNGTQTGVQTVSIPTFTLTAASSVSFTVPDNAFSDNTGGVSIALTLLPANVPEPGSTALVLAALAAAAVARRRVGGG